MFCTADPPTGFVPPTAPPAGTPNPPGAASLTPAASDTPAAAPQCGQNFASSLIGFPHF
jgi:hypothetical protein